MQSPCSRSFSIKIFSPTSNDRAGVKAHRETVFTDRKRVNSRRVCVKSDRKRVYSNRERVLTHLIAAFTGILSERAVFDHEAHVLDDFDARSGERFGYFVVIDARLHPDRFRHFREDVVRMLGDVA